MATGMAGDNALRVAVLWGTSWSSLACMRTRISHPLQAPLVSVPPRCCNGRPADTRVQGAAWAHASAECCSDGVAGPVGGASPRRRAGHPVCTCACVVTGCVTQGVAAQRVGAWAYSVGICAKIRYFFGLQGRHQCGGLPIQSRSGGTRSDGFGERVESTVRVILSDLNNSG